MGKPTCDIRVAYVPTASEVANDRTYAENDRAELIDMGITTENLIVFRLNRKVTLDDLRDFDVVFVEGGNTFYLLQKVLESGFDKAIREYCELDLGVYVGVSAGTILAGPNVEISEPWDDKSLATLTSTQALGFVSTAYCPHYQRKEEQIIGELQSRASYKITPLMDGEAVLVNGAEIKIISG